METAAIAADPGSPARQEPVLSEPRSDGKRYQYWAMSAETDDLHDVLDYLFSRYWSEIEFGTSMQGTSYELVCPVRPKLEFKDGEMLIDFDGPHIHLPLADREKPWGQIRKPSAARMFRILDKDGAPLSWGFEVLNAHGDKPMVIYFASPFYDNGGKRLDQPDWRRLACWEDVAARYLDRAPDTFDRSGKGIW